MIVNSWSHDEWVKAWGWNAPVIVGGTNDEALMHQMPQPPKPYHWLMTRHVDGLQRGYSLALVRTKPRDIQVVSTSDIPVRGDLDEVRSDLGNIATKMMEGIADD